MKKRLYTLLTLVILTISGFLTTSVNAQNRIFEKYDDMKDVEYICITRSMLKLIGEGSLNINGVNVKGLSDAVKILIIINSDNKSVCQQMKEDFKTLKADEKYEMLMQAKDDGERVCVLFNDSSKDNKEMVMYIEEDDEQTFIILTGKLNEDLVNALLTK